MGPSTRFLRLLAAGLLALAGAIALPAAEAVRFSASLTPAQRAEAGLDHLDSDNVAVIDGLVRQDLAASRFKDNAIDHTRFTVRRTARELEISGIGKLSAAERGKLDDLVKGRIDDAEAVAAFQASMSRPPASPAGVETVTVRHPPEIHGQISYTYGWSKRGTYQGGDLVLTYDDPAHRYSVLVGYSEYHGKGLPYCFYPGLEPYLPRDESVMLPR